MAAETSKNCTKCQKPLPLSAFHRNRTSKDGHHGICKECRKQFPSYLTNKWNKENPEKAKEAQRRHYNKYKKEKRKKSKRYRDSLKKQVYDYYRRICTCCGETEEIFLSIDHINNDGAKHRRSSFGRRKRWGGGEPIYTWIIKHNFPDTFQVLCVNCNWAKSRGGCPHQNTSKLS